MTTNRKSQRLRGGVTPLLTATELIATVKIGRRTLRRWQQQGLPHYRRGHIVRYSLREVQVWMHTQFGPAAT